MGSNSKTPLTTTFAWSVTACTPIHRCPPASHFRSVRHARVSGQGWHLHRCLGFELQLQRPRLCVAHRIEQQRRADQGLIGLQEVVISCRKPTEILIGSVSVLGRRKRYVEGGAESFLGFQLQTAAMAFGNPFGRGQTNSVTRKANMRVTKANPAGNWFRNQCEGQSVFPWYAESSARRRSFSARSWASSVFVDVVLVDNSERCRSKTGCHSPITEKKARWRCSLSPYN